MRATTCLGLLAAGAIATFAVHLPDWPVNMQMAGLILMATGIAGFFVPARPSKWMRRRIIVHGQLRAGDPAGQGALAAVPDAELLIVGGPPRDELGGDPVLHQLARLGQRLQVTNRLLFSGQVSQSRRPALLRSADLFVHLASYEPTEIHPLEAMACGTPVIAGAGGADEDAVVDGATGALIRR